MGLHSVQLVSLACIALLVTAVSGAKMREWQCRHNASTGPARLVHLNEPVSHRHQGDFHISRRALGSFRIHVYYDSSVQQTLSPSIANRLKQVVSNLVSFYESALQVRQLEAPIIFDRDCQRGTYYIFNEPPTRRCQFSCVATMCGEVQIPDEHLRACSACYGSSRTCQTTGADGPGVRDTDFVLYVSAISTQSCQGSTIAYASHCHQEDVLDRPIAGHANFCPSKIDSQDTTDEFILAVAKHELLHALAFSTGLYAFWRDGAGNPRTPRDSSGQPPRDSTGYVPSTDTLRTVTYNNWQTMNGPVSHTVTQLVTPMIVAVGRRHFGCPSLGGVEVENQGGSGTALSHWEKRILENEGMTGVISSNPVFSAFTFALLEDSGWYTVDFSKAQQLLWGQDSGCDLPAGSCGGYIQNKLSRGGSIAPFCNRLSIVQPKKRSCNLDRTAISECNLVQFTTSLPQEYQYFRSGENFGPSSGIDLDYTKLGGSTQTADFCPYNRAFSNGNCSDSSEQTTGAQNGFGETYAPGSRCVEHGSVQWVAGGSVYSPQGAGCYQYSCSNGRVILNVLGQAYTCTQDGQQINIDASSGGVQYRGSLICPSCVDICYDDFTNCPAAREKYGSYNNKPAAVVGDPGAASSLVPSLLLTLMLIVATGLGIMAI